MPSKKEGGITLPLVSEEWQLWGVRLSQLIAKAWLDDEFKERFVSDPAAVLDEYGLHVPDGITVRVNENSTEWAVRGNGVVMADVYEIPLPPAPQQSQVMEAWAASAGQPAKSSQSILASSGILSSREELQSSGVLASAGIMTTSSARSSGIMASSGILNSAAIMVSDDDDSPQKA